MAEAKSNAELDLHKLSRDGKYSTYKVVSTAADEGNRVEQILGPPTPAKDETAAKPAAKQTKSSAKAKG